MKPTRTGRIDDRDHRVPTDVAFEPRMRHHRRATPTTLLVAACLSFGGCSATSILHTADQRQQEDAAKTKYPSAAFNEVEARRMLERGTGSIRGVFWTGSDFDRIPIKKTEVILMPATEHVVAWYKLRREHEDERDTRVYMDGRMAQYQRKATTDEYGRLKFDGLKSGRYLLWANVTVHSSYSRQEVVGTGQSQFGATTYYQDRKINTANATDAMAFIDVLDGKESAASLRAKDCYKVVAPFKLLCNMNRD